MTESTETPGLYIVESVHGNALERGRSTGHAWQLIPGRYELHVTLQWDEYGEAYPPRPVDHKHQKPLCLPLLLSPTAEGTAAAEQRQAVATVTIPEPSSEVLLEQASRADCSGFDSPAWTRADFGRFVYPSLPSAAAAPLPSSVTTPVWRPQNCKLRVYTAREVNSCTAARPVLLIGDSHTKEWEDAFDKMWDDRLATCKFDF